MKTVRTEKTPRIRWAGVRVRPK